jgi:hypothetical protein
MREVWRIKEISCNDLPACRRELLGDTGDFRAQRTPDEKENVLLFRDKYEAESCRRVESFGWDS